MGLLGPFVRKLGPKYGSALAFGVLTDDTDPMSSNIWIQGARPRTLPAAVVPVAIGTACAAGTSPVKWWTAVMALIVSVALQIGVNYANDYSDGIRGTDNDRVGPLRLVGSGSVKPAAVKKAAFASFAVAGLSGAVLAAQTSWWLIAVGAAALAAGWFYTGGPKPYGYLGLGELFVFVFFGLVATVGTTFVVTERIATDSVVMGVGVGALACALLVVNNLRDIPTDRLSGKNTLAVRLGAPRTRWLYLGLLVLGFVAAAVVALNRPWVLLALAAAPLAIAPARQVRRGAAGPELIGVLGATGKLQMAYGLLASIGLLISR
jgi:1,4-dihydroxy-2-naphthoate polyprenyltransferase